MNPALTVLPTTDPAALLRYRDGQYAAELIAAALLHFDFFSWLGAHPGVDSAEVGRHFGMAARPLDVLLTLCRANGFVVTDAEGRHRLSVLATEHLVKGSPWFLGPYYAPIRDTPVLRGFLQVLRGGPPANWQAKAGAKDWHESMLDDGFAREFTELMNSRGMIFGQFLAKALTPRLGGRRQLLDVGGGSGIYSATMVAAHPGLSATVLEQPPVDAIVRKEIARHGLAGRVGVASGDMFAMAWPAADVVLMSNVLHDWDLPEVRLLLAKAAAALPTGGLLVIHDAFLHDDRAGPLAVAEYSALLMNITRGKCYSPAEYGAVLAELGFEAGSYQDTVGHRGFMTALKR
jgi:hypothetical protein